jgi:ATP-binding cassette, subfamily G (WHITE), member 2, SNQ2
MVCWLPRSFSLFAFRFFFFVFLVSQRTFPWVPEFTSRWGLVNHLAGHNAAGALSMTLPLIPGPDAHGTTATNLEEQVHPFPDRSNPDQSTLANNENVDLGERPASVRNLASDGLVRTASAGVDVERAEQEFAHLNRQFSAYSERNRRLSKQQTRQRSKSRASDVEKAVSSDESSEEPWDLETTLRGASTADREAGIKVKRIGAFHTFRTAILVLRLLGVTWENLSVRGIGGEKNIVKTFPDAFIDFFNLPGTIMSAFGWGKKGKEFNILQGFRGVAKPSEMVLVLGRPGSGCTTFLKVISNQRFGYTGVDGQVMYGPFDDKTFANAYRGEAVYNQEDDVHHPSLTVGQTLGFALDTKTPGKRPSGVSRREFKEKVVALLLKMFNIEHTKNTVVGGPFIRGISGGERKRVSIAEQMATGATVCAWDNSSRGLDASTAVDFAKSLRVITNIYRTTTFVSLYQASESIYQQVSPLLCHCKVRTLTVPIVRQSFGDRFRSTSVFRPYKGSSTILRESGLS